MWRSVLLVLLVGAMAVAQEATVDKDEVYPVEGGQAVVGVTPSLPQLLDAIHCWNLNEVAGATRVDSCGTNDLDEGTGNNVITQTARDGNGVRGNFSPASCLQGSPVNLGSEWTITFWFRTDILGSDNFSNIVNGDTGGIQTIVSTLGTPTIKMTVQGGATQCSVPNTAFGPEVHSLFSLFSGWRSAADGKLYCNVNNGPVSVSSVAIATSFTPTGNFYASGVGCSFPFGIDTDEITIFDRAISDPEREALLTTFAPF